MQVGFEALFQAWLEVRASTLERAGFQTPAALRNRAREVDHLVPCPHHRLYKQLLKTNLMQDWVQGNTISTSAFQVKVYRELLAVGLRPAVEHRTADGLLRIDTAFPDQMVAVEVDGPQHFYVNTRRPTGAACWLWNAC